MLHKLPSLFPWKHNKTKIMAEPVLLEDASHVIEELAPCDICGRTFLPGPLDKHTRVCEKNAAKKRKVFNSMKQRVEGTDLALFHQRSYLKEKKPPEITARPEAVAPMPVGPQVISSQPNKWKEKHLELVKAIRQAKGVPTEPVAITTTHRRSSTTISAIHERCPSCDRQFGPKAFDRHVEWCKEHKARLPKSPQITQVAKERLEARIKYRVPPLNKAKNRQTIKEKYAGPPGKTESLTSIKSTNQLERRPSNVQQKNSSTNVSRKASIGDGKHEVHSKVDSYRNEPQTKIEKPDRNIETKQPEPQEIIRQPREPMKGSQIHNIFKSLNINTTAVNNLTQELTVSKLMKDTNKLITWKDTVVKKSIISAKKESPLKDDVNIVDSLDELSLSDEDSIHNSPREFGRSPNSVMNGFCNSLNTLLEESESFDKCGSSNHSIANVNSNTLKAENVKGLGKQNLDLITSKDLHLVNEKVKTPDVNFEHIKSIGKPSKDSHVKTLLGEKLKKSVVRHNFDRITKASFSEDSPVKSLVNEKLKTLKKPRHIDAKFKKMPNLNEELTQLDESACSFIADFGRVSSHMDGVKNVDSEVSLTDLESARRQSNYEGINKCFAQVQNVKEDLQAKEIDAVQEIEVEAEDIQENIQEPCLVNKEYDALKAETFGKLEEEYVGKPCDTFEGSAALKAALHSLVDNKFIGDSLAENDGCKVIEWENQNLEEDRGRIEKANDCLVEEKANDSLVKQKANDSLVKQKANDSLVKQKDNDNLVNEKTNDNFVKQKDNFVKQKANDNLVKQKAIDSLVKEKANDNLVKQKANDNLVKEKAKDNLVKQKANDNLVKQKANDCLVKEKANDSLVKQKDNDNLVKQKANDNFVKQKAKDRLVKNYVLTPEGQGRQYVMEWAERNSIRLEDATSENCVTTKNSRETVKKNEAADEIKIACNDLAKKPNFENVYAFGEASVAKFSFQCNGDYQRSTPKCVMMLQNCTKKASDGAGEAQDIPETNEIPVKLTKSHAQNDTKDVECFVQANISSCRGFTARSSNSDRVSIERLDLNSVDNVIFMKDQPFGDLESMQGSCENMYTAALSRARLERELRNCCSEVDPVDHIEGAYFATYSETDLTKFMRLQNVMQSRNIAEQEMTSDEILKIAGEQFLKDQQKKATKSLLITDTSFDSVPSKRRKLQEDIPMPLPVKNCENCLSSNILKIKEMQDKDEIDVTEMKDNESIETDIFNPKNRFLNSTFTIREDCELESASKDHVMAQDSLISDAKKDFIVLRPESVASSSASAISPRVIKILDTVLDDLTDSVDQVVNISMRHCKQLIHLNPNKLAKYRNKANNAKTRSPPLVLPKIVESKKQTREDAMENLFLSSNPRRRLVADYNIKNKVTLPNINVNRNRRGSAENSVNYNPFITAERQLMELLECDDFKPFKPSSPLNMTRPHTTEPKGHHQSSFQSKSVPKSATKLVKRASVIDPPRDFKDAHKDNYFKIFDDKSSSNGSSEKNNILEDNFEMIENFINDNFNDVDVDNLDFDTISMHSNKTCIVNNNFDSLFNKYNDEISIDPRLINEYDNLSIPEHFQGDSATPPDTLPEINNKSFALNDKYYSDDPYSVQYDKKISASDPISFLPKAELRKKSKSFDHEIELDAIISSLDEIDKIAKLSNNNKTPKKQHSFDCSYGLASPIPARKKNLSSLKRTISLLDPVVKPKNLKNKADVQNYFDEQELRSPTRKEHPTAIVATTKEEDVLSGSDLFSVDDVMYEEYKKYEQMYLQEKEEKLLRESKVTTTDDENISVKISGDSAYGSLSRGKPKVRTRVAKLSPLEHHSRVDSASSSGSETSAPHSTTTGHLPAKNNTENANSNSCNKMSKFCHECGNKYPLTTAKFCVECGVKRLVL